MHVRDDILWSLIKMYFKNLMQKTKSCSQYAGKHADFCQQQTIVSLEQYLLLKEVPSSRKILIASMMLGSIS